MTQLPIILNQYDIYEIHNMIVRKTQFSELSLTTLFFNISTIFNEETNVIQINSDNAIIVGDVHGHYYVFFEYIKMFLSDPKNPNIIFLGDYVDRGTHGFEIIVMLCALKYNYPNKVHILRGNHESTSMNERYGFMNECKSKYGEMMYQIVSSIFESMPIAAILTAKSKRYFPSWISSLVVTTSQPAFFTQETRGPYKGLVIITPAPCPANALSATSTASFVPL